MLRGRNRISSTSSQTTRAKSLVSSFNPKPEAMAGVTCERSIPLSAIASGFRLNGWSFRERCCGPDYSSDSGQAFLYPYP